MEETIREKRTGQESLIIGNLVVIVNGVKRTYPVTDEGCTIPSGSEL